MWNGLKGHMEFAEFGVIFVLDEPLVIFDGAYFVWREYDYIVLEYFQ